MLGRFRVIESVVRDAVSDDNGKIDLLKLNALSPAFEKAVSANIYRRSFWVDLNGLAWRIQGRRMVDDPVILRDGKGMLHPAPKPALDPAIIAEYSENLRSVAEFATGLGIPFIYAVAPCKNIGKGSSLPYGLKDMSDDNADRLLSAIRAYGIDTLDLRRSILADGEDASSLFFRTDHHWNAQAALRAAGEISRALSATGVKVEAGSIPSIREMEARTWKRRFLGSFGVRTGRWFVGADDFQVFFPKDGGDFEYGQYGQSEMPKVVRGSFFEALVNRAALDGEYVNSYMAFLYGGYVENRIVNRSLERGVRVLLIADSFGRILAPYLSLGVREVRYIDPQEGRFRGSVTAYIAEYDPDAVVCMFNAEGPYYHLDNSP